MNLRHSRRLGRDTYVRVQAQRSSLIFPLKGDNRKSIPRLPTVLYCTLLKRPRKAAVQRTFTFRGSLSRYLPPLPEPALKSRRTEFRSCCDWRHTQLCRMIHTAA